MKQKKHCHTNSDKKNNRKGGQGQTLVKIENDKNELWEAKIGRKNVKSGERVAKMLKEATF